MSLHCVPVLILFLSLFSSIHCNCPNVIPGHANCKTHVQDNTLGANEKVLFDSFAYMTSPWPKLQNVDAVSVACGQTVLMCTPLSPQIVHLPALDVSSVDNFALNVSLNVLVGGDSTVTACVAYRSELDTTNPIGTSCYSVSSNTPKDLSVPSGMNYAYLVIEEPFPFFCAILQRATVKYSVCPCKVENLVQFPETVINSKAAASGQCLDNAVTDTDLAINTTTCSLQVEGARCHCLPGYEESSGSCKACDENKYSVSGGAACIDCPSNSESAVASSSCTCIKDHYRSASQTLQDKCSRAPSVPLNLEQTSKTSTSLTFSWMCPEVGDLEPVFYTICHNLQSSDGEPSCFNVVQALQCMNEHTITGLEPFSSYEVSITAHNHVSDQEPESEVERIITITGKTKEGIPSSPILKRLCTVVIWKPPVEPRGVLKFFELKFINPNGQEELHVYDATENFHLTTEMQREQDTRVQIRVNNSRAYSAWVPTIAEPLGCGAMTTCPPVPECVCLTEAELVPATEIVPTTQEPVTTTEESIVTTMEPATTTQEPVAVTEEPVSTTQEPTEEPTTPEPTEEPTTSEPTEEPTTSVPTEEPTTSEPTEEPTTSEPTEEPTTPEPTEEPTEEPTTPELTEEPTEEPTTQEPSTEAPTRPPACMNYPECRGGVTITYHDVETTTINIGDVGENHDAVYCCTDYNECCKQQKIGEITNPDGMSFVGKRADQQPYYRNRSGKCIKLNARNDASIGTFGCIIPDDVGTMCCTPFMIV